jgi:hypothetical protein
MMDATKRSGRRGLVHAALLGLQTLARDRHDTPGDSLQQNDDARPHMHGDGHSDAGGATTDATALEKKAVEFCQQVPAVPPFPLFQSAH